MSPDSYRQQLAEGVLEFLAGKDLATWEPEQNYAADVEWPSFTGPDMPAAPDRILVATVGSQTFERADVVSMLQLRFRGTPDADLDEIGAHGQAVRDVLYPRGFPLSHALLGTVRVGAVYPVNEAALDPDRSRRYGLVQNYRIRSRRVPA